MIKEHIPRPIKLIFNKDNAWTKLLWKHGKEIPIWSITSIERMLACGTSLMGGRYYECQKPNCIHSKFIPHTCKNKACSSCGFKATEIWTQQQKTVMPDCEHQHLTFTMPSQFWPLFKNNRWLLNHIFKCAADTLLKWAEKQGIKVGIFGALHTYGRRQSWHPHIHLSVTRGGLNKHRKWKSIFFKKNLVEAHWRRNITTLLRKLYSSIVLPPSLSHQIRDYDEWNRFLNTHYQRKWHVHFAKKTKHLKHTVNYIGRYIKKPPISGSKLRHYAGGDVVFDYLDHNDKTYKSLTLSQEEMLLRFLSHVPDKHFKMIRYFGFLSNRKRGELLPIIYEQLNQIVETAKQPTFCAMFINFTNSNPYRCILCDGPLVFSGYQNGQTNEELLEIRRNTLKRNRRYKPC